MRISVILCTHNPREDYLRRVLEALRFQTLLKHQWEILLIDNASHEYLSDRWDLSWHPHARCIRENELGLTPARLRGIKDSTGELLVFVDDDNVLAYDYLQTAEELATRYPQLGAFGGNIDGEFESPPPAWVAPYLEGLAVFNLDRDYWSNLGGWSVASPYGAGLCVRRQVAEDYSTKVAKCDLRRFLDRSGCAMGSGGDGDLAWCAVDLGLGTGRFVSLRITHLIPERRLTADYIVRLMAGFAASGEILSFLRRNAPAERSYFWKRQLRFWFNFLKARGKLQRRIVVASEIARMEARHLVSALDSIAPNSS